ncbi:hypothetical protein LINPERPRIM_LOCUS32539, partial [Linum perenne]
MQEQRCLRLMLSTSLLLPKARHISKMIPLTAKDQITSQTIGTARLVDGLYVFYQTSSSANTHVLTASNGSSP